MRFYRESELKSKKIFDGISLKSAYGNNSMITLFNLEPNSIVPLHKHPHEQITYILEGALEFTLENETRILKAGDGVVILPNQEHSARVLDKPAKALDAWHPVREDYK